MRLATAALTHSQPRSITLLGATGSIGSSTLKILEQHPEKFVVTALTAHDKVDELAALAHKFHPRLVVIGNEKEYDRLKQLLEGTDITVAAGENALEDAASMPSDLVMAGIVGAAGLRPTLAAIRRGATVALANKECLVCAGELMLKESQQYGATVIPVDSEHNAIFQVLDFARPETIASLTLTASGGPFRSFSYEQMDVVTPEQAVNHPNWNMGAKISIDSATMMNKALEIIEAYYLFPVQASQIKTVIHPESVIHSMVSYIDGSTLAQMGTPDMTTPIACALAWPERIENTTPAPLDLASLGSLTFEAPDTTRFPALRLAYEVLNAGGHTPIAFNAANEVAVTRFLNGAIRFTDIARIVQTTLEKVAGKPKLSGSIEDIIAIDKETREIACTI